MIELLIPLKETLNKSTVKDLDNWFKSYPDDASWYVISDYCFGDKTKKNDTATFSILLNHDKLKNIKEYINAFAPKDIKSTRNIADGFIAYINSPVIFNVTFVIDRSTQYLKDYADVKNMKEFLPAFREVVQKIEMNSKFTDGYIPSVYKRLQSFEEDFTKKNFNAKLARQIYLVATFASLIFYFLTLLKRPSHIGWVSDRDAMVERYNGVIFDIAYFMYLLEYSRCFVKKDNSSIVIVDKPNFIFLQHNGHSDNEYDELIRIPDYLAGTLADLDIEKKELSKKKFYTMLDQSIVNSKNHSIIQVYGNSTKLSARRIGYSA